MFYEACIENLNYLKENLELGVDRIELCDNLFVGGTTPSYGIIRMAREMISNYHRELAVIIRARGGDFIYNRLEKQAMLWDSLQATKLGADRLVIGALEKQDIDYDWISYMIKENRQINSRIQFTFHMAFDHIINKIYRIHAMQKLLDCGVDTILTHGSITKNNILENVEILGEYLEIAEKLGISILVGGGVRKDNIEILCKALPKLKYLHGTRIKI